jgi:two-component system, NarL family, invasion response regulator UvrY
MIRVAVVDDHPIIRFGIRAILKKHRDIEVVGDIGTAAGAVRMCQHLEPAVLVLDYILPDANGLEVLLQLGLLEVKTRVLVFSLLRRPRLAMHLLRHGAAGYLTKAANPEELPDAIRKVSTGHSFLGSDIASQVAEMLSGDDDSPEASLSARELQVLLRFARGRTNREVASDLHISRSTVGTYRARIRVKTGLRNPTEMALFARERQLACTDGHRHRDIEGVTSDAMPGDTA